ncbi:MAG: hypothetical protein RL173_2982 [Fibrobacterota bacterium]|jgi:hypothetical protein
MTSSSARLAILVAILLLGCADDTTRLAGGTGSDLPRPTARLLDTSLNLLDAKVWRLWQVYGDSAKASSQVVDSSGFVVPPSGQWIVEAWKDSAAAGAFEPARRIKIDGKLSECESNLTYLNGMGESIVGVLSCREIEAPSGKLRPPMGWGAFGRSDTIHEIIRMPASLAADAWKFAVWKVDTFTVRPPWVDSVQHKASFLVRHPVVRYAAYKGLMDITTGSGIWLFQAWNGVVPIQDSLEKWEASLQDSMWVDADVLRGCIKSPGFCANQIGEGKPAASYVGIRR